MVAPVPLVPSRWNQLKGRKCPFFQSKDFFLKFFYKNLFMSLHCNAQGLHCCTHVFSSCDKQGLLQLQCVGCSLCGLSCGAQALGYSGFVLYCIENAGFLEERSKFNQTREVIVPAKLAKVVACNHGALPLTQYSPLPQLSFLCFKN